MRYLIGLALALLAVTPAAAQQVDIKKAAPGPTREREPGVIAPALAREERPIDADNYPPHGGCVVVETGVLRGFSPKTPTAPLGLAGWAPPSGSRGGPAACRGADLAPVAHRVSLALGASSRA